MAGTPISLNTHTHTHSAYLRNSPQPLPASPSLPNYTNTLTLLVMSVWSEWQPALLCLLFHFYTHTHTICLLRSGWISSLWFTGGTSHCSPVREWKMYGAETWYFNDLESTQTLYAPTPFFVLFCFPRLLRNSSCHRPACTADLFARQNSRDLAEKHQADSQRASPGWGEEGGVDTHARHSLEIQSCKQTRCAPRGSQIKRQRNKNNNKLKCQSCKYSSNHP